VNPLGDRNVAIVNLDPANEMLPYKPAVDIGELIRLEEVMEKLDLGPNGGLLYCLEYLEQNVDWLEKKLKALPGMYFLFDFPGQVELWTHHSSVQNILSHLTKLDYRISVVNLVDAHHCSDAATFISVVMLCLSTMLQVRGTTATAPQPTDSASPCCSWACRT
jgi:GTPase SAR1 family protein